MIRRPPRFTLPDPRFPDTTLFGSERVRQVAANAAAHVATDLQAKLAAAQAEYGFKLGVALEALRHVGHVLRGGFRAPEVAVAHQFLDRKSTRLNSSH